jgi:hypothetical protein
MKGARVVDLANMKNSKEVNILLNLNIFFKVVMFLFISIS